MGSLTSNQIMQEVGFLEIKEIKIQVSGVRVKGSEIKVQEIRIRDLSKQNRAKVLEEGSEVVDSESNRVDLVASIKGLDQSQEVLDNKLVPHNQGVSVDSKHNLKEASCLNLREDLLHNHKALHKIIKIKVSLKTNLKKVFYKTKEVFSSKTISNKTKFINRTKTKQIKLKTVEALFSSWELL